MRTIHLLTLVGLMGMALLVTACATPSPQFVSEEPVSITLTMEGESQTFTTFTSNVREFLAQADVTVEDADLVEPPLFTPLSNDMEISIVRVTESVEIIEQSVPFQRRSVRNESLSADSPPIIVQSGHEGLQEITVRIVYRDGLEFSRQQTQLTVIEPAQDEIVMIGVGTAQSNVDFPGQLAFIDGGNGVILRGSSAFPDNLGIGGDLDRRVFSLSPTGSHLLYTRISTDTEKFNTLWTVRTEPNSEPMSLEVDNVLWADWNPSRTEDLQLAYTTGIPTELLPGWEANNDLWIGELPDNPRTTFRPQRLVEAYPATYGWWGGNYAWSPDGLYIAYSYADEVGVINIEDEDNEESRTQLHTFSEYNTRADWVWVPTITWSPDGNYLAFTKHASDDPDVASFDTWAVNAESGLASRFVQGSGIWSHPQWSPNTLFSEKPDDDDSRIAFLRASTPLDSQRSTYTLWLMDQDGSNVRQLYPAAGENSRFPNEKSFMAWGPSGHNIAFVYDNDLYLYDVNSHEARQVTNDDNFTSNPTWAPYGRAAIELFAQEEAVLVPSPEEGPRGKTPAE